MLLNGQYTEVHNVRPTDSVLDHLRRQQHLPGTKEGCAEGDCGACTVVVGELHDEELRLRTVNACLLWVPMLDGKALFTVEYLRQADGSLHPVQQAMVEHHGSQCGFCTPGFIMSLWSCYVAHQAKGTLPSREELAYTLTGNLCRCTGYRPILDAGEAMFSLPAAAFDQASLCAALSTMQRSESLCLPHPEGDFHAPGSLEQLVEMKGDNEAITILAGCTDIGLWVNKQFRDLGDIAYICNIPELRQIRESSDALTIGAGVSLTDAYQSIARRYPQLHLLWDRFASVPIRNAGTLGGNVANGSPIGDSMPWLLVLEAQVELCSRRGRRTIPLEQLYTGYMKKSMAADEIISAVILPLAPQGLQFRTYKLAKRRDSDISAVCAAFAFRLDGTTVVEPRVAYGGMAAIPARARACESALRGKPWTEATVREAMQALSEDFTPLDDMRASAAYRIKTARNLLYRCFLETRQDAAQPAQFTQVFHSEFLNAQERS